MEDDTISVLKSLENDLRLEMRDCQAQQQRVEAALLQRLINALNRNIERRQAAERADQE